MSVYDKSQHSLAFFIIQISDQPMNNGTCSNAVVCCHQQPAKVR